MKYLKWMNKQINKNVQKFELTPNCTLNLGIWKKMKNKKGGPNWTPQPFLSRASLEAHKPTLLLKP
jgi:hypothetical protein